jgi:imidazolonepropionase-like amidohydrolase
MSDGQYTAIVHAGHLFDGLCGALKPKVSILICGDRIQAIAPTEAVCRELPPETDIFDFRSYYAMPGLIDTHTHLSLAGDGRVYSQMFSESDEMMMLTGAMNLQRHLSAGITTIREHGARNRIGFTLKEGLQRGYIPGPRMLVSGRPITCTGGHFHQCNEIADGEEEIRRSVRRLVHEGADFIKIMASGGGTEGTIPGRASYSTAELHAAVHEAHHFHRPTVAHCRASESMIRAIKAGVDLMEHAEFLDPDDQLRFDPKIAEMMAESGIWISPTLQAWTNYPRIMELKTRQENETVTPDEAQELSALEQRAELRLDIARRMLDHGLLQRMVPGTDSGVNRISFGHLDYDLQLLVRIGFTPEQAITSATRISAEAAGQDKDIGTIEPGKIADFILVDGDPTADISNCSRIAAVFQAGRKVSRS